MRKLISSPKLPKLPKVPKLPKHPVIIQELHFRITELESELRRYPAAAPSDRLLKAVLHPEEAMIGEEKVVQFTFKEKPYAVGHTDVTFSGSNHARGVRHIRFYQAGTVVLDIEGDFEDQQFGSNFRFKNIDAHTPGEWEADLTKLTEDLRAHIAKRKAAFKKKRDAEHARASR